MQKKSVSLYCSLVIVFSFCSSQIFAQYFDLWGTNFSGGYSESGVVLPYQYGRGNVFRYDPQRSTIGIQHNFNHIGSIDPAYWSETINYTGGLIYGISGHKAQGKEFNMSFIYKINTNNGAFEVADTFPYLRGNFLMYTMAMVNQKMYGISNYSDFVEFDPAVDSIKLIKQASALNSGNWTVALSGVRELNGKLYSVSKSILDSGAIYEYDLVNDTIYKKTNLTATSGYDFQCNLLPSLRGSLFGICKKGGRYNKGTLFEYFPSTNSLVTRFEFDSIDGSQPINTLALDTNGNVYGTTQAGGLNNKGVIFVLNTRTNSISTLYHIPSNSLFEEYKTMSDVYNGKIIINRIYQRWVTSNYVTYSTLNEFDINTRTMTIKNTNVEYLRGRSTLLPNGKLGIIAARKVYEIDTSKYSINNLLDSVSTVIANKPDNTLLYTRDKLVYGVSKYGGNDDAGTVFKINPKDSSIKRIFSFHYSGGHTPEGGLVEARNRKLYGTTSGLGKSLNSGTIYEVNPNTDKVKEVFRFNRNKGENPMSSLIVGNDSELYGTTIAGGINGDGVIYKFDTKSNKQTVLFQFNSSNKGAKRPEGKLFLMNENILYGLTVFGGKYGYGVAYSFDLNTGVYKVLFDFDKSAGYPKGGFIEHSNGLLYAYFTQGDGSVPSMKYGGLVSLNPKTNAIQLLGFNVNKGSKPSGEWVEGEYGVIFGITTVGKTYSGGYQVPSQLISYDPKLNSFKREINLSSKAHSSLIKVPICRGVKSYSSLSDSTCSTYFSPSKFFKWDSTGVYNDTLVNSVGCDSIITVSLFSGRISYANKVTDTLCDKSMLSPSKKYNWSTSGIYFDTLTNSGGCDSILEFDLTMLKNSSFSYSLFSCDSFISPSGKLYTKNATVRDTIQAANGCDSSVTIFLKVIITDTAVVKNGNVLTNIGVAPHYQWLDCNNNMAAIPGAINNRYEPTQMGDYAVSIKNQECRDTSRCHAVYWTGQEKKIKMEGIKIYPNPANTGFINVDVLEKKNLDLVIDIYDAVGKKVNHYYFGGDEEKRVVQIDVEDLSGLYFLSIIYGDLKLLKKVVINQ